MSDSPLVVVEQRQVLLYDDAVTAVRADDGNIYVSVTQMCQALGIDAQGQRRRIGRHAVLSKGLEGVDNLSTPGGMQSAYLLRVDLLPLWLSGIRAQSVREEIREKLEVYQQNAAAVLWRAFQTGELSTDVDFSELLRSDTPEVQAYKMIMAMAQMARQQILLRAQVNTHTEQLDEHSQRLDQIEATLGDPDRHISTVQASRISQAVKAIALELGKRSGRNEFGGVYGELYRRFEIAGYRELPAAKYEEAMSFLRQWHGSVTDGEVPF